MDPSTVHLPTDRRGHVLDGDPHGPGGGHRHGTGRPDKTEFPERWDDPTAVAHIVSVARDPDEPPLMQDNGRWQVRGHRDGVEVVAILHRDGRIWTAYPEPGGRGVVQNPPRSDDGR